jgi:hypothetical protein
MKCKILDFAVDISVYCSLIKLYYNLQPVSYNGGAKTIIYHTRLMQANLGSGTHCLPSALQSGNVCKVVSLFQTVFDMLNRYWHTLLGPPVLSALGLKGKARKK